MLTQRWLQLAHRRLLAPRRQLKPLRTCARSSATVFLNATLISYMYEQTGDFTVADSLNAVSDKLIRRHPHVFGATEGFAGPGLCGQN